MENADEILTLLKIEEASRGHPNLKTINEHAVAALTEINNELIEDDAIEAEKETHPEPVKTVPVSRTK